MSSFRRSRAVTVVAWVSRFDDDLSEQANDFFVGCLRLEDDEHENRGVFVRR
jgi:hypothetical protein